MARTGCDVMCLQALKLHRGGLLEGAVTGCPAHQGVFALVTLGRFFFDVGVKI